MLDIGSFLARGLGEGVKHDENTGVLLMLRHALYGHCLSFKKNFLERYTSSDFYESHV